MTTASARLTPYLVAPLVCAGVIGGAAIGLGKIASAPTASATTVTAPEIVATPHTTATPWVPAPRQRIVVVDPFVASAGGE